MAFRGHCGNYFKLQSQNSEEVLEAVADVELLSFVGGQKTLQIMSLHGSLSFFHKFTFLLQFKLPAVI